MNKLNIYLPIIRGALLTKGICPALKTIDPENINKEVTIKIITNDMSLTDFSDHINNEL